MMWREKNLRIVTGLVLFFLGACVTACGREELLPWQTYARGARIPVETMSVMETRQPSGASRALTLTLTPQGDGTPFGPSPMSTPTLAPCGLAFPLVSSDFHGDIQLFAGPQPLQAGSHLYYCVIFNAAAFEIPVPLRFYLPEGARFVQAEGAGWHCSVLPKRPDIVECANAIVGRGVPSLLIEATAPSQSGDLRACVEVNKASGPTLRVCITTQSG